MDPRGGRLPPFIRPAQPKVTPFIGFLRSTDLTVMLLARISHTNRRIGSPNQRKLLCRNDFARVRGAPDADRVYHAIA
jgi:hypothetical protein